GAAKAAGVDRADAIRQTALRPQAADELTVRFDVFRTSVAEEDIRGLRADVRRRVERVEADLARRGCRVASYRLTGEQVERICCTPLPGAGHGRVLVGFPSALEVAVLMVGQHEERSARNVYRRLYASLGIADPPAGERDKPPCCDEDGAAPEDEEIAQG